MTTRVLCPECKVSAYVPVGVTVNEQGVMRLELRSDSVKDIERFNKVFPPETQFTLQVERSQDAATRQAVVTITPVFEKRPNREFTAKPPPEIPQSLDELREVAVRSGIINAEKMSKEQIRDALEKRNERIGQGARSRAQLNGLEAVGEKK